MNLATLQRNDAHSAIAIYRRLAARGPVSGDVSHVLLMMQDDPSELFALLGREP